MDALDRFIANHKQPFQKVRLDSILRSKGIMAQSITTTKTDTMVWQPSMLPHTSIWQPVMTVSFPYDIFEGQQVVVKTAIGMSPIIRRMTYTLLITITAHRGYPTGISAHDDSRTETAYIDVEDVCVVYGQ